MARSKSVRTEPVKAVSGEAAPNPVWFKPVMLGFMLLGLLWIIVFYISGSVWPIESLGQWNIVVGFGIMLIGFLMTTRWRGSPRRGTLPDPTARSAHSSPQPEVHARPRSPRYTRPPPQALPRPPTPPAPTARIAHPSPQPEVHARPRSPRYTRPPRQALAGPSTTPRGAIQ